MMGLLLMMGFADSQKSDRTAMPDITNMKSSFANHAQEKEDRAAGMIICPFMSKYDSGGRMVDREYCRSACFGRGCLEAGKCWENRKGVK